MKTPKIFAIAAAVSFALCAQAHNKMTTGDWLAIDDYPAYVGELATYAYENFGIKDNLVPAVKSAWRDQRITVTNNINHYAGVAQAARAELFAGNVQVEPVQADAEEATLYPAEVIIHESTLVTKSLRPMIRTKEMEQRFAIQKALIDAGATN